MKFFDNYLIKFDRYCIARAQEIYLWLLDYTGVYRATIQTILLMIVLALDILRDVITWLSIVCFAILLSMAVLDYINQDKGKYEIMNYAAMKMRESIFRLVALFCIIIIPMIVSAIQMNFLTVISDMVYMVWWYTMLVMVRDREPKEWFKKEKLVFGNI